MAEGSFGFLEFLVDHATEDVLLVRCAQRLRGKMDAAFSQLGEVGFVPCLRNLLASCDARQTGSTPMTGLLVPGRYVSILGRKPMLLPMPAQTDWIGTEQRILRQMDRPARTRLEQLRLARFLKPLRRHQHPAVIRQRPGTAIEEPMRGLRERQDIMQELHRVRHLET